MTMTGPSAVGERDALGAGDVDGTAPDEGGGARVGDGTTGLGVGLAVAGSGEKTVCGGAGSSGRAWGSDEPQPARPTTRPSATRAAAFGRAVTRSPSARHVRAGSPQRPVPA